MEYLITIKQPYVDYIFLHEKIYEVRKIIPKELSSGDVIYFCVKGNGSFVVGSFVVDKLIFIPTMLTQLYYLKKIMIGSSDLISYVRKNESEEIGDVLKREIYLIGITDVRRIKPFHVRLLGLKSAPQGFVKIDSSKIIRK